MKRFVALALAAALCVPAFAKGGSFSAPRVSTAPRVAPAPRPVTVNKNVTVKRTTVVNQTVQTGPSAGSTFMSSAIGSFAGAGIASWLFSKPAQAPAPAVIDCSRNPLPPEWLQHCPKNPQ